LLALLNPIKRDPDIAKVRAGLTGAGPNGGWPAFVAKVFAEEEVRLMASLAGRADQLVKDFPAKTYYELAAKSLDFTSESLARTMCLWLPRE
jgi:hypothetical protein